MKLLIITQKVDKNDAILGFFHAWILDFAKNCEKLIVICLEKGEYDLPENVKILSLGKEVASQRLKYIVNFYKYIWQERKNYDSVFVHMNVEYVILGGLLWKILAKKIALWYMHKSITLKLKLATSLSDYIFTGTKESFRLSSSKLKILHHGIDNNLFIFKEKEKHPELRLLTVSRISAIKQVDLMLESLAILKQKINRPVVLKIVGEAITKKDNLYLADLKLKVHELALDNEVEFLGSIANQRVVDIYNWADIFLNFSKTGSLDKTILEAMSCGTLVLSSNDASRSFLPADCFIDQLGPESIAEKIINLSLLTDDANKILASQLSEYVSNNHNLKKLIFEISSFLK